MKILCMALIIITHVILSGCATSFTELKAPCNERAVTCGEKIKINSW